MWDPYAEFEKDVLPNGLSVYAAHWPGRPWEAVGIVIRSGARHDSVGLEGTAHFVEHLVSENSGMPKDRIKNFFNSRGGIAELGTTGFTSSYYRFLSPINPATLKTGLGYYGKMLIGAELQKYVEREREVIVGEFNRKFPLQYEIEMADQARIMAFAGCFLERFFSPLGRLETIARISQSDIQKYYDMHYVPHNMCIVALGGVETGRIVEIIGNSVFGKGRKGKCRPLPAVHARFSDPVEKRYVIDLAQRSIGGQSDSCQFLCAARIPGNVRIGAIRIFADMLGNVLFKRIREKLAWTYHIGVNATTFWSLNRFMVYCQSLKKDAFGLIEDELDRCIRGLKIDQRLFRKIKKELIAEKRMFDGSGWRIINESSSDIGTFHRIISLADEIADFHNTQMDEIVRIAEMLEPDKRWIGIIKP